MDSLSMASFQPRTVEKVERLFDLLSEIQRHPVLRGKLAMYGGTAINLFMLDVPRLSVDIDISYIGELSREGMLAERPAIEQALIDVGEYLGYRVFAGEGGHAGRTFVFRYRGNWGIDHVKIDCIYMNRSPLFLPRLRQCCLRPDVEVLMFEDAELAGGKVKAFYDRVKIRDLYDIANLRRHFDNVGDSSQITHRTLLYYASVSACFPNDFADRGIRFAERQQEFEDQLLPILRGSEEPPTLEGLIMSAETFIRDYILPRNENEKRYLELFSRGDFRPELLFGEGDVARAARQSPEALWKLSNIRKMIESDAE